MTINLSEAKAHLGRYVARAKAGEVVTICERNKPLAELHPAGTSLKPGKLKIGVLKGQFAVPDKFDAALPEFESSFYEQPRRKSKSAP